MAGSRKQADPGDAVRQEVREGGDFLRRHGRRLLLLFGGLLLPLCGFLALSGQVRGAGALPFDEPLLLVVQRMAGEGVDRVFLFFSAIGYEYGVLPICIVLVPGLALMRRFRESVFAAVALGGSALLNLAAKQFYARTRPSLWESIAPASTYSFPSGHAMGSMALAVVLALLAWPTRWRWPVLATMAVFVPMVGLSRVYLGVHFTSDILAGWAVALAWVVGIYQLAFPGKR